MPLLVERDRWAAWLDPRRPKDDLLLDLLVPAAPGTLEAFPVSTAVEQREQQRARAGRAAPAADGRPTVTTRRRRAASTPRTATARLVTYRAESPRATAGAQPRRGRRHRRPRPRGAGRGTCRGTASPCVLVEQPWRVAGRKVATPAADPRRRPGSRPRTGSRCARRWSWAGARSVPGPRRGRAQTARRRGLPGAGVPAAPAGPAREDPGRRAARGAGPDPGDPGRAGPVRPARGVPRRPRHCAVVPAADHGLKVPASGPVTQAEALEHHRRVDPGVAGARGRRATDSSRGMRRS